MSDGARVMVGILCLLVFCSPIPVAAQAAPQSGISGVSISGDGVIEVIDGGNNTTYLWQDEPFNVSVTVAGYPKTKNYGICLGYAREGAPAKSFVNSCTSISLSNEVTGTREFKNVTWPANITGEQKLIIEVGKRSYQNNVTLLDRKTIPVTILKKQGDIDSDGLTNVKEVTKGYNISDPDMDSDLLSDGEEVNKYNSNPQDPDSDDDGIRDGEEIQHRTDPTEADTDGDGLSDSIERALGTNANDDFTPIWLVVVVVVVIGIFVATFVLVRHGWREWFGGSVISDEDREGETTTTDHEEERTPEPATEPTPEPLTDEDRVQQLLREHGGRMKQSHIVEETEWSKAKVSRLLSSMNDDGAIEKLTIGRENVISLDGHGPDAADSPHDERSDASS